MDYPTKLRISKPHKNIYNSIRFAMTTAGREKAKKRYKCNNFGSLRGKWEGYHLLEFANTIRPPEEDDKGRNNLDDILTKNNIDGFTIIQNQPSDNSAFTRVKSDAIFNSLAEFQNIPLLVCFLNFLEFCRKYYLPLSVFDDKTIVSMSLEDLIIDIKRHIEMQKNKLEKEWNQHNPHTAHPSSYQPRLTLKQARENNHNYYANATLEVIGRDKEQQRLKDFLDCHLNVAWFQLAGVAGQGKSRLALELTHHAKDLGWSAGFLEENDIRFFNGQWQTWQPDKPHLIIFDYVVGREDQIKPILQTLAYRREEFLHKVRVLLVERQQWGKGISFNTKLLSESNGAEFKFSDSCESKAAWFLSLCQDNIYDGNDPTLNDARFDNGVEELEKLDEDKLIQLVRQIAKYVSDKELVVSDSFIKETLHRIDKSGRPLYAYFLGQELAYGTIIQGWSSYDLLNAALRRERMKWWAAAFNNEPPFLEDDTLSSRLAVLATMTDGINFSKKHENSLIPKATPKIRRQALALISGLISNNVDAPSQHIPAMQPDLLGEWYVIASFDAGGLPLEELTTIAWRYAPEKMGSFMQRLYQDFQDHPIEKAMLDCVDLDQVDTKALAKVANTLLARLHRDELFVHDKIIKALLIEADNGDSLSMRNLGVCYENGIGIGQDILKSNEYRKKAADKGCTFSMVNLGARHIYGKGVEQDIDKAIGYFKKAAEAGNTDAMLNLGICYKNSEGVEKDINKAVDYWEKAAELGDDVALYWFGNCFKNGDGADQSIFKAVDCWEKAVDAGNTEAMFSLGVCYKNGEGVEKDINKAVEYWKKAAKAGNTYAMLNLGICYKNGEGVKQNIDKAISYFKKAAEASNTDAMLNLGICYKNGEGVEKDINKAVEYWEKSAKEGNTDAMFNLGICYKNGDGVEQDIIKTIDYWGKAAAAGANIADAIFDLGTCYKNGEGVKKDINKAVYCWDKAAEAGNAEAMVNLGICYKNGEGVEKDINKAVEYWEKSAKEGNTDAMFNLGICYKNGTGVEQNIIKALYCWRPAADAGNANAMFNIGYYYINGDIMNRQSIVKAVDYFKKAAEAGNADAMFNLGFCYKNGEGVEKDIDKAIDYWKKSTMADKTNAMFHFVLNLLNGSNDDCTISYTWAEKQTTNPLTYDCPYKPLKIGKWRSPPSKKATQILSYFYQTLEVSKMLGDLENIKFQCIRFVPLSFYSGYYLADIKFYCSENRESRFCSILVGEKGAAPLNGEASMIHTIK